MAARYCRPSDLLQDSATITVTAGTEHGSYPRTNLQDRLAHTVAKFTGTSGTFRATFGGGKTLQAVVCVNTNATAIQLTNAAGLNQALTIPATPADGRPLDPWIDLRGLASTSSTQWNVALTGPTGVALGELLLVETLRELPVLWGVVEAEAHPAKLQTTEYGVRHKYGLGVRGRRVQARVDQEAVRADVLALQRDARGALRSFLFVLDDDPIYVDLTTDERAITRTFLSTSSLDLEFTEQQKGWLG